LAIFIPPPKGPFITDMKQRTKRLLRRTNAVAASSLGAGRLIAAPPIPQALSFHHFADDRALWGIPNFGNVSSNLPFLVVAIIGLVTVVRSTAATAG
jgi:hypothetical protein